MSEFKLLSSWGGIKLYCRDGDADVYTQEQVDAMCCVQDPLPEVKEEKPKEEIAEPKTPEVFDVPVPEVPKAKKKRRRKKKGVE